MQDKNTPASVWRLIGFLALIATLIVLFVIFVDLGEVGRQLRNADGRYLFASSLFLILGLVAYAIRWRLLLANEPSLIYTFRASNIGHAGNILIPARGGELFRVLMMGRNDAVLTAEAASSYVVERLFEQAMRPLSLAGAVAFGVGIELSPTNVLVGYDLESLTA